MNEQQLQSLSDTELQIAANPHLARAANEFTPIKVYLDYESCWQLLATIQLAYSHRLAKVSPAVMRCKEIAEELALRIAPTPELKEIVRRGWEERG